VVENTLINAFALYIYVPQTTHDFYLALKWKKAGHPLSKTASFTLVSPDDRSIKMELGMEDAWSEQLIQANGAWGIWQLRAETGDPAPRPSTANSATLNQTASSTLFSARTRGEVDLFARPEACVSWRGSLPFSTWDPASLERHRLTVLVPRLKRVRFNFRLP